MANVDRVDIDEAFAVIALGCPREIGLAQDVVNVEGGAIAHSHPIGASGAVLTTRLMHSMRCRCDGGHRANTPAELRAHGL